MPGDGRSSAPREGPKRRARRGPDEEVRYGRDMRPDWAQEDGGDPHVRRPVARSTNRGMAAEKRRPQTSSVARRQPKGA